LSDALGVLGLALTPTRSRDPGMAKAKQKEIAAALAQRATLTLRE
jgi:hypothetical protein